MNDETRGMLDCRAPKLTGSCTVLAGLLTASLSFAQGTIPSGPQAANLPPPPQESSTPPRTESTPSDTSIWERATIDVNLGTPKLASGEFKLIGDATLGYAADKFGIVASGSMFFYDLENSAGLVQTERRGGSGEAWFVTGDERETFRLELRGTGGGMYYETDRFQGAYFFNEGSQMGYGTLSVGLRLRPDPTFHLQALLGGGVLWERYDYLTTDPASQKMLADTDTLSFRMDGRLHAHWQFLPGILSARVVGNGARFSLTRTNSSWSVGAPAFANDVSKFHQLELRGRLSVELDVAAFIGLIPFLYGAVDHISASGDAGSKFITVPSGGVGLNKPFW